MRLKIFVIILLISILCVTAEDIEKDYDTTITVDWIGNDEFVLRTEDHDHTYSCNNQNDTSLKINFTRTISERECNSSLNTLLVLEGIVNMSQEFDYMTNVMVEEYNYTKQYATEKALKEWCENQYKECKFRRTELESKDKNNTIELDICDKERNNFLNLHTVCNTKLINLTSELRIITDKNKGGFLLYILAFGAGCLAVYLYNESQGTKRQRPKQMGDMGHGTTEPAKRRQWEVRK